VQVEALQAELAALKDTSTSCVAAGSSGGAASGTSGSGSSGMVATGSAASAAPPAHGGMGRGGTVDCSPGEVWACAAAVAGSLLMYMAFEDFVLRAWALA
jgi:hypothetical protein